MGVKVEVVVYCFITLTLTILCYADYHYTCNVILTLCIVLTCHHHVITFIASVARVQGHHHFAP
jgi:hypothetical protein